MSSAATIYRKEHPEYYKQERTKDNAYNDVLVDIYYSYYGIKPTENQKIICIDGYMFNFSKHNLKIIDIN